MTEPSPTMVTRGVFPGSFGTLFQTLKNAIFHSSFHTRHLKPYPFSNLVMAEIKSSFFYSSELKQKDCLKSYSLGTETINTFMYSFSSLENRTGFQTKMDKVYTSRQKKNSAKTIRGRYKGVHAPPAAYSPARTHLFGSRNLNSINLSSQPSIERGVLENKLRSGPVKFRYK